MRPSTVCGTALAGAALVASAPAQPRQAGDLAGMINTYQTYIDTTLAGEDYVGGSKVCRHATVTKRKEWRALSQTERTSYLNAVQCMVSKRTQSNRRKVPGARNRYDDFVASHLIEGNYIHFNGHLLGWHRHFVWLYEQALRTECNYKGAQPYWDWTLDAADLLASPVFDGSPYSMGNNGEYFEHGSTHLEAFGLVLDLPPGTGGGCLKSGPFQNLVVNLGLNMTISPPGGNQTATIPETVENAETEALAPAFNLTGVVQNITSTVDEAFSVFEDYSPVGVIPYNEALNYNPRCLRRDLNLFWPQMLDAANMEFLLSCTDVDCLERRIDGFETNDPTAPAAHPGGHFSVGGLQNDPFASPGDPIFFLIHAQIDRLWAIWQAQDPAVRLNQVGGTTKPLDRDRTGQPVTLEDKLSFGVIDGKRKLKNLLSTTEKFYCYAYDG